jgi:hypothetical protein
MELENKDIQIIEDFLEGKLRGEEALLFEQRIQADNDFREQVESLRNLFSGIRFSAMKTSLKKLEASLPEIETKREAKIISFKNYKVVIAVAASIVVILAGTWLFPGNNMNNESLFNEYYSAYPNITNTITRGGSTVDDIKQEAFLAYDKEDYNKASELFNRILEKERTPFILLYAGNSSLSAGKNTKAIGIFRELLSTPSDFEIQGKWFLSLALIRENKIAEAKILLLQLKENGSSYSNKAGFLLNKINSN